MEALLSLALQYGMGLPWVILAVAIIFIYKKLMHIEQRLQNVFSKQETKEWIDMEMAPTRQIMESMAKSMDKMSDAIDKLDETMDEIKIELTKRHSS